MAVHMLSEERKTRIEHALDTKSVAVGVWLYRRTRGRITSLWRRRAIVLTTTGRRSGRDRTVLVQVFEDGAEMFFRGVSAVWMRLKPFSWIKTDG